MDKFDKSGFIMLIFGMILLVFTFFCAYSILSGSSFLGSQNLVETFDKAIGTLFLGVMGWVGSIFTSRGVQLLQSEKELPPLPQPSAEEEKKKAAKESKPEENETDYEKEKLAKTEEPKETESEKSEQVIEPPNILVPA